LERKESQPPNRGEEVQSFERRPTLKKTRGGVRRNLGGEKKKFFSKKLEDREESRQGIFLLIEGKEGDVLVSALPNFLKGGKGSVPTVREGRSHCESTHEFR